MTRARRLGAALILLAAAGVNFGWRIVPQSRPALAPSPALPYPVEVQEVARWADFGGR